VTRAWVWRGLLGGQAALRQRERERERERARERERDRERERERQREAGVTVPPSLSPAAVVCAGTCWIVKDYKGKGQEGSTM
jgi:hypothetical protein